MEVALPPLKAAEEDGDPTLQMANMIALTG